jgi:hypothetical protein
MSEFTFSCPLCQQDIICDAQYHGHQLQCPICHGEITAPEAAAQSAGPLALKGPGGAKHTPYMPRFHQQPVVDRKSGMGKLVKITATILLVLVILFFMARITGLDSRLPSFLGRRSTATAAATSAGSAPGQSAASPAETAAAAPVAPPPPPAPVAWTTNLAHAVIPTNAAHGRITATDFKYDSAWVNNGILSLRQGKDSSPDLELGVFFGLKAGESLSGKTIDIAQEARLAPRVWKRWKVEGKLALQQKVYSKGYTMKLQFGDVSEDKVTGKIYLCLPDEDQSVVAGSFVASVGAAIAAQPAAQPTTPAAPQMSEEMRKRYGVRNPARP